MTTTLRAFRGAFRFYHLQLTATNPALGYFNWSDGNYGAVDDIYNGGAYRVWFTNSNGCVSSADTTVPMSPDNFAPYFPTGCYTLCTAQTPLTLYGPPRVTFDSWSWDKENIPVLSGSNSMMAPYKITSSGSYQWELENLGCTKMIGDFDVQVEKCGECPKLFYGKLACDPRNPASFMLSINLYSLFPGTSYTLGTDIGPIAPFSGTMPTAGLQPTMILTFTTLRVPAPPFITVMVEYTLPSGGKCYQELKMAVPPCIWEAEKHGDSTAQKEIGNAMLVYPNPASQEVNVSYDYGNGKFSERSISIFDQLGRKIANTIVQDNHGNWNLNTSDWVPGIYIIRMEGDGQPLQVQRLVVSN